MPASALRSYDDLIDMRVRELMQSWPTLDEAHACVNCKSIMRALVNAKCPRCGSESTFDLAAALASPRADATANANASINININASELQPMLDRLDAVLSS